jgi:hypothetical protein
MSKPLTESSRFSLYARVLGAQAACLPPVLSRLHGAGERYISGILKVRVAKGLLMRLLLRLARMPQAGDKIVAVRIVPREEGEDWYRLFGDRKLFTRQDGGDGRWIVERIGLLTIYLQLQVRGGRLWLHSSITRFCGLRLPGILGIQVVARERAAGPDIFHSDVRVRSPLLGPLLRYSGTLRLE